MPENQFYPESVFLGPLDIFEKLKILSDSAKYDASCSSSGSNRRNSSSGIGNGNIIPSDSSRYICVF